MLKLSRSVQKRFINSIEEDEFYYGEWWLPHSPMTKLMGILYFKKALGIRLHLLGSFKIEPNPEKLKTVDVIVGNLIPGGASITLIRCDEYERNNPFFFGEAKSSQRFEAKHAVFGVQFRDISAFAFDGVEFSTTYLIDWINPSLVDVQSRQGQITLLGGVDDEIKCQYGNVNVKFVTRCQHLETPDHVNGFKHQTFIVVEPSEKILFEDYLTKFIDPLRSFIQFGTSHLNSVTFINGLLNDASQPLRIITTSGFDKIRKSKNSEQQVFYNQLFSFSDIRDELAMILSKWLTLNEKHLHIFALYFDSLQLDQQFPVTKFLILEQAIESFHTEKELESGIKNTIGKEQFIKNKNEILAALGNEMQKWLNEKLNYLPELKTRLNDLVSECRDLMIPIVHDVETFIKRVVKTRNYYTHYNPNLKGKHAVGIELEMLTHAIRVLINFHLLNDMGLSKEKSLEIIKNSTYYRKVKSACEDWGLWNRPKN